MLLISHPLRPVTHSRAILYKIAVGFSLHCSARGVDMEGVELSLSQEVSNSPSSGTWLSLDAACDFKTAHMGHCK